MTRARFALILAALFALAPAAHAAPPADTEATNEARAKALLAVLPKPRPERKAFVEQNFAPEAIARRGLDELTGITADLHDDLGEAKLVAVRAGVNEVELVLRTPDDQWFELRLRFDAEARILGLMLAPGEAPETRSAKGPVPESGIAAAARELVDARVAKGFSGAVIVAKDGRPVFSAASGEADRATHRANTLDTPINLGSMNKMFTALVIGRLVEQGKVGWDDKVGKHLPDWPQARVRDEVTVAQLLSHTSGLRAYWGEEHDRRRTELDTAAEYAELCDDQAPAFTPGERFEYSNCGFVVLGLIAERAGKKDYYELVRELVYRPAGMVNSDHYDRGDDASQRAIGYLGNGEGNMESLAKRGAPAGGGYASANDLLRFATALNAGRIVKPETLKVLTTGRVAMGPPGPPPPKDAKPGERRGPPPGAMYGYGFGVISGAGEPFFGHNGGAPGVSADLAMFASGWTVIVLSNQDRGAGSVAQGLQRMVGTRGPG